MELNSPIISLLAGTLCGIISGFGIGGGSILMIWLTAIASVDQKTAQAINLLYFLPTALAALIFHLKHKMVCNQAVLPAALAGCASAAVSAWLSAGVDVSILRKLFGAFLIIIGVLEFRKSKTS